MVTFNRFLFTRDDEDYGYRIHTDNIPSGLINEVMAMIDLSLIHISEPTRP